MILKFSALIVATMLCDRFDVHAQSSEPAPAVESTTAEEELPIEQPAQQEVPVYDNPDDLLPEAKGRAQGFLGELRIGPSIGLSIPHPYNYGIDAIYKGKFGFGFTTGKYQASQSFEDVEVELQMTHWDVRVRWFPWEKNFFLGLGYGSQTIYVSAAENLEFSSNGFSFAVPVVGEIEATTTYILPHVGWFLVWDCGFSMGFELGLQVPTGNDLAYNFGFSTVTASQFEEIKKQKDYKDLETEIKDAGDLLAKTILPHITLIKLGWLF